jgi:hypothetical protein
VTRTVDESELRVSRQIYLLCKLPLSKLDLEREAKDDPIYKVDLKNFLSALFFIASQYAGGIDTKGKYLAPSTRSMELHPLLCKAFTVFENWPNGYFAFLDWRRSQMTDTQPAAGLGKDFAGYKSALYIQLASSQLDFMRDAFKQYLSSQWDGGYTAHLRRLSETDRQNGRYASRREAKILLKIGVKGIDSLIAAGKLKAIVRSRRGSRLILIERESLREFNRELEQSLYLKQVEEVLGVSRKRILELIESGLLTALRGPIIDGCSDWRFSQSKVELLLSRVREKVQTLTKACNTVSFLMAFRKLVRVNIRLGDFVSAIINNEVSPCGNDSKQGLAGLLFLKEDISAFACEQRRVQMGEVFTASEIAKLLGVTQGVIYFFTRKGILSNQSKHCGHHSDLLISKDALELFNATYILPAKIAAQLGTVSGYLIGLLMAQGIHPISGPKIDGGRQYIFRRSDFDRVDITEIISSAKTQY